MYGFVRREGLMDGILIGSCVTGREQIECMLETDTENIGGYGKKSPGAWRYAADLGCRRILGNGVG